MNHNHKMGEVVLVNKQKIISFTTIVHNLATLRPDQITSRNRDLLAKVTKILEINIRFVVIQG